MYVSAMESVTEQYCKANNIDVPEAKNWTDLHNTLEYSKFRVERAFNNCPDELRKMLLNFAALDSGDKVEGHHSGNRLHHYTEEGQRKIARAFRKVRLLSSLFPQSITEWEFTQIDPKRKK